MLDLYGRNDINEMLLLIDCKLYFINIVDKMLKFWQKETWKKIIESIRPSLKTNVNGIYCSNCEHQFCDFTKECIIISINRNKCPGCWVELSWDAKRRRVEILYWLDKWPMHTKVGLFG